MLSVSLTQKVSLFQEVDGEGGNSYRSVKIAPDDEYLIYHGNVMAQITDYSPMQS